MNAKQIKQVIRAEIKWCKTHRGTSNKGEDFEKGFIQGLEQALRLAGKKLK
jgi:hypothetical protein